LLALNDSSTGGQIGSIDFKNFASRSFTYYVTAVKTDNSGAGTAGDPKCLTTWYPSTGEDLDTKYGGVDVNESVHLFDHGRTPIYPSPMVASETVNGSCPSCGGGIYAGVKRNYYYLAIQGWTPPPALGGSSGYNEKVNFAIIEDTVTNVNSSAYRNIYGLGYNGHKLREVFLPDPAAEPDSAWCKSMKVNTDWRITEQRMPSAHKDEVAGNADIAKCLNPTSGTNDADTVSATEGVVYHYEYTNSLGIGNGKYQTGVLVSKGTTNPKHYIKATNWTNYGTGGATNFQMSSSFEYPTAITTRSSNAGEIETTYSYTFWSGTNDTVTKTKTTTLPAISTGENGSGTATTTSKYYDTYGRLRWTKDGEGYVNYYSYHPYTGARSYEAIDVNDPSSPGSEITSGSTGKWIAWTEGDADGNYPTRGSGLPTGLALVSKTEYDDLGRSSLNVNPSGAKHYIAYEAKRITQSPTGMQRPRTRWCQFKLRKTMAVASSPVSIPLSATRRA
jgi:hypothetical protein